MKKSKSRKKLDRLSELPDSLILSILGLLPMRDVVATTVLSKRWRNLWTTAPCLSFVDWESEYFITRALMFWRGTKILKFEIEMSYKLDKHIKKNIGSLFKKKKKNIDSWVRFAKDFMVQELYLHLAVDDPHKVDDGEEHHVPQYSFYLSSCPLLQVLSLKGCDVHIHRNVQWNQLKSLTITTENGLRCADIDHVLGCSPRLEVLVLRFYETGEHLIIRSTSLKKLSIDKFIRCYDEARPMMNTRLIISTTDLETLEISNVPYSYCSFSVSSLTEVSLLFDDCGNQYVNDDLLEEALKQILPRIQHVKNVTLSSYTIMALWELISKHLAPRSWDVKFLKLYTGFSHHYDIYIVAALEFFSKVKMLVLEDISEELSGVIKRDLEFQPNLPNLTSVEVIWGVWDSSVLRLIEVLLKYASSLGKMVLRVKGLSSCQPEPEEELERLQRSFPGKLIVCGC